MLRKCDVCDVEYEAQRPSSRYCSSRCRVRNTRSPRPKPVATLPPVPAPAAGGLTESTRVELAKAGRTDTPLGQASLLMARRLDAAVREPGMGMAALVREYRATFEQAVKGAQTAASPMDELRARRDNKLAG